MKGTVFLRGFEAHARIGCTEEEQQEVQPLVIDVSCATDMGKAVKSDNREDCVDYDAIHRIVAESVARPPYHLLESLADEIAQRVIRLKHALEVTVTIEKPNKFSECDAVGVSLTLTHREVFHLR